MKNTFLLLSIAILLGFSSCLTPAKLDKHVAEQYNNQLPKARKKKADITVVNPDTSGAEISTSFKKTDKFLPLIVYWQVDGRKTCSLNPSIPVANFTNAINSSTTKKLTDKLNGRTLELTIEQAPNSFSIVSKERVIWLIYAISWMKVYIEPDFKDLVVSYKLLDAGAVTKTGTVTVKNTDNNKGIRWFQSWKSATSEWLVTYNASFNAMAKAVMNQLVEEL